MSDKIVADDLVDVALTSPQHVTSGPAAQIIGPDRHRQRPCCTCPAHPRRQVGYSSTYLIAAICCDELGVGISRRPNSICGCLTSKVTC